VRVAELLKYDGEEHLNTLAIGKKPNRTVGNIEMRTLHDFRKAKNIFFPRAPPPHTPDNDGSQAAGPIFAIT
jgi:hypothetical protein